MSAPQIPQPRGDDWRAWGGQLVRSLLRQLVTLNFKGADDNPSENGIILWDDINGYPVVSKNNEWRQIVLEDGHYEGGISSDVTAVAINTAYALTFTASTSEGITNGTPASRIVFAEGGHYTISFSAQTSSASGSTVTFRFWPRINGTDTAGSTMVANLHQNDATIVVTRTASFVVSADDYLEAMWAVNSTSGFLEAVTATAYAPAAPAATISITRLHA